MKHNTTLKTRRGVNISKVFRPRTIVLLDYSSPFLSRSSSSLNKSSLSRKLQRIESFNKNPNRTKLLGSHILPPRIFSSYKECIDYYNKYLDYYRITTHMFTFTTINHKTSDTHHPLLLLTNREGHRYLIGKIGEGAQRTLNDNKFRLAKLKGIFMTGTLSSWDQIGGLPGLFLTISDATKNSIEVFANCSSILNYIVATWRYFVFRKGVELKTNDVSDGSIIADSNMFVDPILIPSIHKPVKSDLSYAETLKKLVSLMFPLDTSAVNDPDPESYKSDPADNDIHSHISISDLPVSGFHQDSLSYMFRFVPLRGKFNPTKAKELGIKPGKDFAQLTQGNSVTTANGDVITPDQVMGAAIHFKKVLVLDIPSNDYLVNTITSTRWFDKNDEQHGQEDVGLVYHLLGDDIDFKSPQYVDFIKKFPLDCTHIISHSNLSNNTITFKTFTAELLKLRAIQKEYFNLPYCEPYNNAGAHQLHHLQQFNVVPSGVEYDDSLVFKADWSGLYDEYVAPLNLPNADKEATLDKSPLPLGIISPNFKDNVQITTLGTGSALPSIYRNVISNLVRIPFRTANGVEFKSVLFDGGENTLGSLMRTFGHDDQLTTILLELRMIFLSHLHADHHLGLVSIINKWFEVNKENDHTLHLVVPWQYDHFLQEWYKLETKQFDLSRINYVSCEEFLRNRVPEYQRISFEEFGQRFDAGETTIDIPRAKLKPINQYNLARLYEDLNILEFQTCRAIHCFWAYSVSVTFNLDNQDTFKVSYSGDTRPNVKFIEIGLESDLLIHESSLDNDLIEEAIAKKHTTMIEAVNIARLMNCKKLILTHFSTRYSGSANYIATEDEFSRLSNDLKRYLRNYGSIKNTNIFELYDGQRPIKSFDELEILFAFDSLIVRLNNIHHQKANLQLMNEISDVGEDGKESEKKRKESERQRIKQEAKRVKRLAQKRSPSP